MDDEQNSRGPLILEHSGLKFAIFGYQNRRRAIAAMSEGTPLDLLGAVPLEEIEISPQGHFQFLWKLIDFSCKPVNWVMSAGFHVGQGDPGSQRLVLVWRGLSTKRDKSAIKEIFDRNAIDIAEAALRKDHWRGVMSVSPLIAQCRSAELRNMRWRAAFWACLAALLIIGLLVSVRGGDITSSQRARLHALCAERYAIPPDWRDLCAEMRLLPSAEQP